MQAVFGRAIVMLVLAAGGAGLWTMGRLERQIAEGHKRLATFQYAAQAEEYPNMERSLRFAGRLPAEGGALRAEAREQLASAEYWQGQYAALTPERDASGALVEHDPEVLFLSANAQYHANDVSTADRTAKVRGFEDVMKSYVDVMKGSPGHADAAYNYEFVVRKRNLLAAPKPAPLKPDAPATIHGRPGAPPKDSEFTSFKIVVPKRSEEREDPNAGKGDQKIRRG